MNQNLQFHVFETRTSETIGSFISLKKLLEKIKNGDAYKPQIEAIRDTGTATTNYKELIDRRECIIWNATSKLPGLNNKKINQGALHMYKQNMSIQVIHASLGLLKACPYLIAAWISLDGTGIECLFRCDEVSSNNYQVIWQEINDEMGLDFAFIDVPHEERNLISYDPNIYCNWSASSFASAQTTPLKASSNFKLFSSPGSYNVGASNKVQSSLLNKEYGHIAPDDYDYSGDRFRYQTELKDYVFGDEEFIVFPEGISFYKVNTYYEVFGDNRYYTLYAQAAILMILNPFLDQTAFFKPLDEINWYQCRPRLNKDEIYRIVMRQFERKEAGELTMPHRSRKIVYKTGSRLSTDTKLQINGVVSGKLKRDATTLFIRACIADLMDSLTYISQKLVVEKTGKSLRTIKYYWNLFKEDIALHNSTIACN